MTSAAVYKAKVERRERRLSIRDVDYCVHEWGNDRSPLLFYLHGWADTGSTFQFVVDALAENWFVVAPDWRGFGRSRCQCESYWFPDYLADLHEIVAQYSPDQALQMVGHSMGPNIAALYAGIYPERVRALVNIEGFGLPDSDPDDAPHRYREWIDAGATAPSFSDYSGFSALAHRVQKRSPNIAADRAEFVAREWGFEAADGRVHLRADAKHKMPNAVLYRRAEADACWRNVRADVLLVSGDQSEFMVRFNASGNLPFAARKSVVIEGAGHMIQFEAAGELAASIENFLQKTLVNTSSTV
jgi:pimeloyl-ACP methyl ester carboxylesterase